MFKPHPRMTSRCVETCAGANCLLRLSSRGLCKIVGLRRPWRPSANVFWCGNALHVARPRLSLLRGEERSVCGPLLHMRRRCASRVARDVSVNVSNIYTRNTEGDIQAPKTSTKLHGRTATGMMSLRLDGRCTGGQIQHFNTSRNIYELATLSTLSYRHPRCATARVQVGLGSSSRETLPGNRLANGAGTHTVQAEPAPLRTARSSTPPAGTYPRALLRAAPPENSRRQD